MSAPSRETVRALIDAASPVVITHDITTRRGRLLTPNDLRRAFQKENVTVSISHEGSFRPQAGAKISGRRMPFPDFATYVENSNQDNERLYLSQFPLDEAPPVLRSDVAISSYVPDNHSLVTKNLWFGPAGTITPLHFDRSHNLLQQHWGRKHIVMVDPSHLDLLKPGSKNSGTPHVSSLDLVTSNFCINLSGLSTPCLEAVLEPGDILFVPAFWWHHVVSADAAISVNYWWRPPMSACLYPSFFRMLSSRSVYRDPSVVTRWVDPTPHRLDTDLCLFLANEGHTFAAAALAGAIVTAFCDKVLGLLGMADYERPTRETETDALPDFAQVATVIPALTAQGLITGSQCDLLLKWLELAEETAAEPAPCVYTPERAVAVRNMISRLHAELGRWLSM